MRTRILTRWLCAIAASTLLLLGLSACQSKEEKTISKLNKLAERVDKQGEDFTAEEWSKAMEDLGAIHEEMENCDFSKEQLKEVGRLDGKLSVIIAKEGAKALGKETVSFLGRLNSFALGVKEGIEEKYDESDFQQIEEEITNEIDSLSKDWK